MLLSRGRRMGSKSRNKAGHSGSGKKADEVQAGHTGNTPTNELTPGMVTRIFDRVRQIKMRHPEQSRNIDALESEIRDRLMRIKDSIDEFPKNDRGLITVLVINGVHKMCDEILIDEDEADDSAEGDD